MLSNPEHQMGPLITTDADGDSELEQNSGIDALPQVNRDTWEKSSIGPPKTWSDTLRSFAAFITTLPHPSAIFWGDELVLLYNEAWSVATDGAAKQGVKYKQLLGDEAVSMIRTALLGRTRQTLQPEIFVKKIAQDGMKCLALLSPLFEGYNKIGSGVLVQLLPMSPKQVQRKTEQQDMMRQVQESLNDKTGLDGAVESGRSALDDLPLDENPFFQRFAAMLPTGMAILNYKAEAVFVNEQFFELTKSAGQNFKSWPQSIHPEDYDRVMSAYQESFKGSGKTLRIEFRTIGPKDNWRLLMLSPLGDSRMRDKSIEKYGGFVCAVIDITPNKAQELAQRRAADEALERKEQQERFIDMISHEIRNPLSAVLHCAEEILEIVQAKKADEVEKIEFSKADTSAINESAETIKLCVTHQKNIVDDILSFSKLDASMLSLCPRSVQPRRQLADTLKMFQPEIKKQHMELDYIIDTSYEEVGIDWVMADLIRISQVLVNLITNAIKFTAKKEGERKITTMVGASIERPSSYPPNIVFFDTEDHGFRMDGTNSSDWGNGRALYIMVAVKDTGIGISATDQKKLFQRFRQATPKTEESYGGSGLGLMISRKLCQLHGGEIGVSSIEGVGSTFGFFFRVRRAEDKDRPSKKEQLSSSEITEQIHKLTKGDAPIEDVPDEQMQENLKNPRVEHTEAASPGVKGDAMWENTAEIASHVGEAREDEYGQKSRPTLSSTRSMGSGGAGSETRAPSTLEKMQMRTDSDVHEEKAVDKSSTTSASVENQEGRPHILLVEDNVINQRVIKRMLEGKKFIVTTASNGSEAVEVVKQHSRTRRNSQPQFDVILMDQEMPVLDGNAATMRIRELEKDGEVFHTPILGVTANVREEQRNNMVEAGMDDVISKPYSMEDLVAKIEALVERHRQGWEATLARRGKDRGPNG
ncbi:uncharacterized protein PV09_04834 [Verruconis gallopava]|uniref:histidine kinase n=1 Tax=Verruconis gallopava TaxID=253628 RepID=A0A0D2AB71_9PEZI|nr:uncharacterized protein PV09_04834 [Verruconis gallopava]KIW04008.1 hypothetical protein PV09_04834 [Verruconis gallopava]